MKNSLTVHAVAKNEERYIWYAVTSVIDWADKVLLWDTGSTDRTLQIMEEIKKRYPDKVSLKSLGDVNPEEFTEVRNRMLSETKTSWFAIVDGDEVWWEGSICELRKTIDREGDRLNSLVSRYYNVVGDIYHYQEEAAGKYTIDGVTGHITIRAVRRTLPDLRFGGPHGVQGIFSGNTLVQNLPQVRRKHLKGRYLHFTNVIRSSVHEKDLLVPKRGLKLKYEIGNSFPADFYYPEVFFRPRPAVVPSPWRKLSADFYSKALYQTPLRKIKRRLLSSKSGY